MDHLAAQLADKERLLRERDATIAELHQQVQRLAKQGSECFPTSV
ncbi:hypothetical protein ACFQLX_22340 [Streptomyces polyrhachis]|uniref:Transposase n=1 Tax=Streptomyces polyrhachis TaxID=1282885 RepID=A0ABW2GN38_9ACTN